uniref:Retrovirus-related Pol polyprotein from transposon TNT 1-94 n=1 Tax=Cajanus cajan TaxID=3821 RepID=A0A151SQP3_CAJCA|nr:Retrovirus-related Pol polyprotein from transposon TNT 1-94 [Cajanus cajan]
MHKKRDSKTSNTNIHGPISIWVPKTEIVPVADLFNKDKKSQSWYLDSGCSRHLTDERSMFLDLKSKKGGQVTFGGGQKGYIMGIGKIGINSSTSIDNVLYVKGLTHNLLSISQLCDSGYEVSSNKNKCTMNQPDSSILFTANRCNNLYKIMLNELENQNVDCLVSYENNHLIFFKLNKDLYGLKQAPRAWYEKLSSFLVENNFTRGKIDRALFRKVIKDDFIIVQIYVDDIIFGTTNEKLYQEFSKLMQDEFEMSMMGELKFFLGLQIVQSDEGVMIHQTKYTKELLQKFKMEDVKPMKTPMHPSTTLGLDEEDSTMYRGMVGSLLYLTASRPEIMFSVCVCGGFQVRPKEVHLQEVKRILRYLKGTPNLGINFYRFHNFSILGYCDADYAGDKWERKSTNGGCHFLGRCLVSWTSKRQSTIALSTCEVEYVSAGQCLTQLLWIKHQLEDYDIYESNIPVLYDNTAAINISKNLVLHSRTKHIEIKHHLLEIMCKKVPLN